jgi:Xaa-Pro aminopeptidase
MLLSGKGFDIFLPVNRISGMAKRIISLQKLLVKERLDGLIVSGLNNIRYLCGYTGSNGMMVVTRRQAVFYTDFRYQEQMKGEVRGCEKRVLERDLYAAFPVAELKRMVKGKRSARIGVEESNLSLARFRMLRRQLAGFKLVPVRDLVLELRRQKDAGELKLISRAQEITEQAFSRVLKLVKPGVSERELALEIEFYFRKYGEVAFPSIVAFGENAAKPHARAGERRLKKGDCITFDIGCRYQGYCADMTRTVFLGRPDPELRRVYEAVLRAQQEALEIIRPGVPCKLVDLTARDYLNRQGLGEYFGHSLGHGVGLDVHEQPTLARTSKQILEAGDVVTVEPGVYLPGRGGVRIEDLVLVTRTGCQNFTRVSKELIIL